MTQVGFTLVLGSDEGLLMPPAGDPVLLRPTMADAAILQRLCRADPQAPLRIISDSPQIRLQPITLPPVGWLDRQKLLARQLAPHDLAVIRQQSGDSQLLSCDGDAALTFWLAQLAEIPNPVLGITFSPVILGALLRRLQPAATPWQIMLCPMPNGGLRQVVLRHGQLFLTRSVAIQNLSQLPEQITAELHATASFLARHGLTDAAQLSGLVVLDQAMITTAQKLILKDNLQLLSPAQAASQLRLPACQTFEQLLGNFTRRSWHRLNPCLPKPLRAQRQQHLVSTAFHRISAAVWLGLLVVLGWQGASLLTLQQQNKKLSSQLNSLRVAYQAVYQPVATLIAPLEAMRQAEARQHLLQSPVLSPAAVITQLQSVLPDTVHVQRLEWRSADGQPATEQITLHGSVTENIADTLQTALPDYELTTSDSPTGMILQFRRRP